MSKKTYIISLPLLLLTVAALTGCIRGVTGDSLAPVGEQVEESDHVSVDEQVQESDSHVAVDPRVEEALKTDESIKVLISLGRPAGPVSEWTDLERRENAARRQDAVLASLTDDDFRLTQAFEDVAAISGYITTTGLEILRNHPDVTGIGRSQGEPMRDIILDSDGE